MFKFGPVSLILAASAVLAGAQLAIRLLVTTPPPLASAALWTAAVLAVTARIALATPQD